MNYPHLHIMINHFPVVGSILALLLLGWALLARRRDYIRLSLVVTLFVGLSTVPAFLSGNEAHEQLEDVAGFDHHQIHEHKRAADWALWIMLGTAAVAAVALWSSRNDRPVPRWAGTATMAGLILSASVVARAAWLGGSIRHPETSGPLWAPPDVSKSVLLDSTSGGGHAKHEDHDD
jgi:hypothetical protein